MNTRCFQTSTTTFPFPFPLSTSLFLQTLWTWWSDSNRVCARNRYVGLILAVLGTVCIGTPLLPFLPSIEPSANRIARHEFRHHQKGAFRLDHTDRSEIPGMRAVAHHTAGFG